MTYQALIDNVFVICCAWYIVQFARLLVGHLADDEYKNLEYKHMRSGGIRMWASNGKINIRTNGDDRDHSQRCQDSLAEAYFVRRKLALYPVTRLFVLFVLYMLSSFH